MKAEFFSRQGCHLCELMYSQVRALFPDDVPIRVIDIDEDPELQRRYDFRVPVFAVDGEIFAEGRLDEADFIDQLNHYSK